MYKKSPKNCFKPSLQSSASLSSASVSTAAAYSATSIAAQRINDITTLTSATASAGGGGGHHSDSSKTNNGGPILSYFNYFLLPQVDTQMCENGDYIPLDMKITHTNDEQKVYVSSSIYAHLCDIKHQIEQYQDTWDNIKKFTNPYEYIHSNISGNKTNISKLRPLSRSFYKMIEIMKNTNMLLRYERMYATKPDLKMGIKTFHLAEGPGGFIEALTYLRGLGYQRYTSNEKNAGASSGGGVFGGVSGGDSTSSPIYILKRNTEFHDEYMKEQEILKVSRRIFDSQKEGMNTSTTIYANDRYYGMTLVNDDPICPGWKKTRAFLESHPNVMIENGADKTGNLISLDNFIYCADKYKNTMDIVTADGGFDFSLDFNQQENMATQLIFCEVFYALAIQKQGGSFILKIFDVFHKTTVDILYILSYYYYNVSIMKPYTSRVANSEKYIICQGFKVADSHAIIQQFIGVFPSLLNGVLSSFLPFQHDLYYLNRIEEMNAMVSFQQIENITSTLSIITNHRNAEKLEQYKRANVNKCIAWCEKYEIPYNAQHACFQSTNIFLHKSIQPPQAPALLPANHTRVVLTAAAASAPT
jgi:23S rRNA U2552 (ribose-2'-O)-methylase RlmE/FtsJ